MLNDSPLLGQRWLRIVPHVNDTVLLAAGIGLAVASAQYPLVQNWLSAKLLGLCLYVVLGAIALKPGRPKAVRAAAYVIALLTVAWIISVAVTRQPAGYFSSLL